MNPASSSPDHLDVLTKFAWGDISLASMEAMLSEAVGSPMRQNPMMRPFGLNRICPEPRIRITRAHLERVLERKRRKQMSDQDLIDWATMLVINDAYYWDASDAILGEWIGRLHLDTVPEP